MKVISILAVIVCLVAFTVVAYPKWRDYSWRRKATKADEAKFNPKATRGELDEAARALGIVFPKEIEDLYLNHVDGAPHFTVFYRLMPLWEVLKMNKLYQSLGDLSEVLVKHHLHLFWTDNNSNFLGMFTDGPLAGRITVLEHDGHYLGDISPLFRSLASLQEQLMKIDHWNRIAAQNEINDLDEEKAKAAFGDKYVFPGLSPWETAYFDEVTRPDYPADRALDESEKAAYAWVKSYLEQGEFLNDDERRFIFFTFARLAPLEDLDRVHELLELDAPWGTAGHICGHLFLRGSKASLGPIARCALKGDGNSREEAKRTLAMYITTGKATREEVMAVYTSLGGEIEEVLKYVTVSDN